MEPGNDVSDEARALLGVASRLTREVFAPAERELDALPAGSELRQHPAYSAAMAKAHDAGFRRLLLPAASDGLEAPLGLTLAVADTLAQGAPGFASSLLGDAVLTAVAARFADADAPQAAALRDIIADTEAAEPRLAWAFADIGGEPGGPVRVSGGLDLDLHRGGFLAPSLNDSNWPLCLRQVAGIAAATHLLLVVVPETAVYLVPLDGATPAPVRRLGLRVHPHADVEIDGRMLTTERIAIGAQRGAAFLEAMLSVLALGAAARGAGLLHYAHEQALGFARTRVQGGKPIVEHETVAEVLWEARANVTIIRGAVAHAASVPAIPDLATSLATRDLARRGVTKGVVEMTELLGGYGITTEYPLEKLYRDAQTLAQGGGRVLGSGVFTHLTLA